jgi:hypothetical protein
VDVIVCPGCGMRVQPNKGYRCPQCHTFLHPDPLRRLEADLADRFRRWFIEELPTIEWLRPPDVDFSPEVVQRTPLETLVDQISGGARVSPLVPRPYTRIAKVVAFLDPKRHLLEAVVRTIRGLSNPDYVQTIGVAFFVRDVPVENGKASEVIRTQIWTLDLAERGLAIARLYCRGAKGGLYAFNLDDHTSFDRLEDWVRCAQPRSRAIPGALVGVLPQKKPVLEVDPEDIAAFAKAHQLPYYEITSTTDLTPILAQLGLEILSRPASIERKRGAKSYGASRPGAKPK